jgi:hypothetical protein
MTGRPDAKPGAESQPVVAEVLAFEGLPPAVRGSRRALVRWSDGSRGEAVRWYDDEVLFCEGDHGNPRLMAPGPRSPRTQRHRARVRGT